MYIFASCFISQIHLCRILEETNTPNRSICAGFLRIDSFLKREHTGSM